MDVENDFAGENKSYTITLNPSENGKTTRIVWAYDVDYGWDLMWRYAGLYIHGKPDATVQTAVANMANMLASFPNVDYKDQDIQIAEVTGVPVLVLFDQGAAHARRGRIRQDGGGCQDRSSHEEGRPERRGAGADGHDQLGRRELRLRRIDSGRLDHVHARRQYLHDYGPGVVSDLVEDVTVEDAPHELKMGDHDEDGYLIVEDGVRAKISYSGLALVTEYTGSPAALPLLRLQEKAYAETHGYLYSEMNGGRFWDEVTATDEEGTQTFKVTLPVEP